MKILTILVACTLVFACASDTANVDSSSPILEPVESVAEEAVVEPPAPPASPLLAKLQGRFAELGYEGVGLDLESDEVLALLLKVFADPSTANRKIQSVYTGAANAYDASHESLTLGGTRDVKTILTFIKKKVPVRPKRKG